MAYTDFTLEIIEENFGVINQRAILFPKIEPVAISPFLKDALETADELPIRSEKAKSEGVVFPLLVELRKRNNKYFTIYSGDSLNVDDSRGLRGECDFIIAKEVRSFAVNYPILQVVEAKRHDIELGVGQCTAQLLGAKIFNEKRNIHLPKIYGCVTNKAEWKFLKLEGNVVYIDERTYSYAEMSEILGVFQYIIDYYKEILK
jgi:hypothetical protein